MMIGNTLSKKYYRLLGKIVDLSNGNTSQMISVRDVNCNLRLDRMELKNVIEYFQDLGYINIETIGGPFLYGHITITGQGLEKFDQLA